MIVENIHFDNTPECMQALIVALYIGVGEFLSEQGFTDICLPEDVRRNNAKIALLLLLLNLLLQLGVVVDSCWGWARLRRRMVTLMRKKTNSVQPVNSLELGDVQVEEQRGEITEHVSTTPATEKVHTISNNWKKIFINKISKNLTILRRRRKYLSI